MIRSHPAIGSSAAPTPRVNPPDHRHLRLLRARRERPRDRRAAEKRDAPQSEDEVEENQHISIW
jgi:hypothetical protein